MLQNFPEHRRNFHLCKSVNEESILRKEDKGNRVLMAGDNKGEHCASTLRDLRQKLLFSPATKVNLISYERVFGHRDLNLHERPPEINGVVQ